jgi:hypothetical protein
MAMTRQKYGKTRARQEHGKTIAKASQRTNTHLKSLNGTYQAYHAPPKQQGLQH